MCELRFLAGLQDGGRCGGRIGRAQRAEYDG